MAGYLVRNYFAIVSYRRQLTGAIMSHIKPAKELAKLKIFESESDVSTGVCEFVIELANKSIGDHGRFTIGLSGGSMAKILCAGLPQMQTDWSKWFVFFCDERHVPYTDKECTYTIYKDGLFSKVPIPADNIFPSDPTLSVSEAAVKYKGHLVGVFGEGVAHFDLLMLGMGPDGHTCSLFPGHPLLEDKKLRLTEKLLSNTVIFFGLTHPLDRDEEQGAWVAAICDSLKPPPERITFLYPIILNAANCMFVAVGAGKAETVKRVLEGTEEPLLPASRVRPIHGTLYWFLDTAAASLLSGANL